MPIAASIPPGSRRPATGSSRGCTATPAGAGGDRHGIAHVVEMAVGHEHHVARLDLVGALRAVRVRQERVQDESLAPGDRISKQEWPFHVKVVSRSSATVVPPAASPGVLILSAGVRDYTRERARAADRQQPRLHQLDRAHGAGGRRVRDRVAGSLADLRDAWICPLHGHLRTAVRRARVVLGRTLPATLGDSPVVTNPASMPRGGPRSPRSS